MKKETLLRCVLYSLKGHLREMLSWWQAVMMTQLQVHNIMDLLVVVVVVVVGVGVVVVYSQV